MFPALSRNTLRFFELIGFLFGIIGITMYYHIKDVPEINSFYKYGLLLFSIGSIIIDGYLVLAK